MTEIFWTNMYGLLRYILICSEDCCICSCQEHVKASMQIQDLCQVGKWQLIFQHRTQGAQMDLAKWQPILT